MTVERVGDGRHWEARLEGGVLYVDGVALDLEALSGPEPQRVYVYATPQGGPTLDPTDWLGAEVLLPARPLEQVEVGEMVYQLEDGGEVVERREPVYEWRPTPLRADLVRVRLFALPILDALEVRHDL
ncbi:MULTISPECIES: hypothetical protein [Thermus]|uniref:Uncharacterized protein n=1 Tax=Thermus brockianus TaxID=56956 RepID=A0A1J0LVS0_THEBO|nr:MULTISPECIES: hypothetical protein [Thermus]APD10210.1 hypothetical protein A0O31_02157 [Thermus brockianus]